MKNFDPQGYTRSKWSDPNNVKNRPHSCDKSHSFCNIQYQWATEVSKMRPINRPVIASQYLTNIDLPLSSEKVININYDSITEENLDDWIAQSMNRSLASMLNPQKKFFLPPQYDQQLRQRYRKNLELKKNMQQDTYFNSKRGQKKTKSYLNNDRRKKVCVNDLYFDYKKLQPRHEMIGTPIRVRQAKKNQKKQIKRRNAVILNNDVHYARFLKQLNKQKSVSIEAPQQQQIIIPTKNMIYSYNIESMSRKSCHDNVPCSIIQKQYQRIKQPQKDLLTAHRALMNKQEQLHQKYRLQMNQKTSNVISQMKQMATIQKTSTQNANTTATTGIKRNFNITNKSTINHHTLSQSQQQKDKKYLQNKVIKLLNDMQVQSEPIDEDMSKLNIHVNEIFLQHPDSRPQTKWILKAQQKIKNGKNLLAIDCYKQAIILQPELFIPVFNIAVLLQKQNMLQSSRLWFNLSRQFQTDSENVLFGISLVALKQLRYNDSLIGINQLIHKLQSKKQQPEQQPKKIQSIYYYIRALCNKELGFYKQAKNDYNLISAEMKPTNFNVLTNFIFSVVYAKARRIQMNFNCLSYMNFRENIFIILYQNKRKIKQNDINLVDLAEKLSKLSFFCRFSINLIKKLLKIATYEQKQKGQLIFSSKNTTSILINGIVSLKSHEKQFNRPEMISLLQQGSIIGAGQLENNISYRPNSWFMSESKVQFITVPRQDFQFFWKGQITFQMDFKYCFLRNIQLFKNLSQCTLFKLCEHFEKKTYQRGQVLFNDCSYRVQMISKPGRGFGLAKTANRTDARMIHSGLTSTLTKQTKAKQRRRQKPKMLQMIKKHIFKFNEMKFNRKKFPGIFVVSKGTVELQDDRGFRCNGLIGERDFFGQNLFIDTDGYHNYGRLVAQSQHLQVLLLSVQKLVWFFNLEDKNIMIQNCKKRQTIETVRFLRNRFNQCQAVKAQCRVNN